MLSVINWKKTCAENKEKSCWSNRNNKKKMWEMLNYTFFAWFEPFADT